MPPSSRCANGPASKSPLTWSAAADVAFAVVSHRSRQARHETCTAVVEQVACGYHHTVALSESGSVFAFGRNDYGQLGLGHRESTW